MDKQLTNIGIIRESRNDENRTPLVPEHIKKYKEPANLEEKRNDPKLLNKTNYKIEWPLCEGSQECVLQKLSHHVEDFIIWLTDANGLVIDRKDKEE